MPSPATWAAAAMRQLGREDSITPYWVHAIIVRMHSNGRVACAAAVGPGRPLCSRRLPVQPPDCAGPALPLAVQDAMMKATPEGMRNRNVLAAMQQKRLEAKQRKAA